MQEGRDREKCTHDCLDDAFGTLGQVRVGRRDDVLRRLEVLDVARSRLDLDKVPRIQCEVRETLDGRLGESTDLL